MWSEDALRRRLGPGGVLSNLIRVAAVITAYELLKADVVENLQGFYARKWTVGAGGASAIESEEYRREVLARATNKVEASLDWLVSNEVITADEAEVMQRLHAERGRMVHEIGRLIVDPNVKPDDQIVRHAASVARSLARFWGGIEVETDPALDAAEVDYDEIQSGTSMLLDYLAELASGAITAFEQLPPDVADDTGGSAAPD